MSHILLQDHHCVVVIGNTDTTEGRGMSYPIVYAENRTAAMPKAKGRGVWGSDARIEDTVVDVFVPNGNWNEAYVHTINGSGAGAFSKQKISYLKN